LDWAYFKRAATTESSLFSTSLVQVLFPPEIQLTNDIRYPVAKACRFFTECKVLGEEHLDTAVSYNTVALSF
jgi:hypothetical protein